MRNFRLFALTAVVGLCLLASTSKTNAQVSVDVGVAPECPYGYYDYAPYRCAPYGTMVRSGLPAGFLLVLVRGSMALQTSAAT